MDYNERWELHSQSRGNRRHSDERGTCAQSCVGLPDSCYPHLTPVSDPWIGVAEQGWGELRAVSTTPVKESLNHSWSILAPPALPMCCQSPVSCLCPLLPINHFFIHLEDWSSLYTTSSPACHGKTLGRNSRRCIKAI